jgi:hypothetical protein
MKEVKKKKGKENYGKRDHVRKNGLKTHRGAVAKQVWQER